MLKDKVIIVEDFAVGSEDSTRMFWAATPARTVRRGHFWITGERVPATGMG